MLFEKSVLDINDLIISLEYRAMNFDGEPRKISLNNTKIWRVIDTQCDGRCFTFTMPHNLTKHGLLGF